MTAEKKRILDIIVPHYKEPWMIVKPFFDVLASQKMVDFDDFRVILVHDGVPAFSERYFMDNPVHIEQQMIKHQGVSACRNVGLRNSYAEWVCFCDCDDCFTSIFSIMMILHVLKNSENFDLVWNQFYVSPMEGGQLTKMDKFNNVFIHNKYYRRSFLREHDIWFAKNLHMSEDSAFNNVVKMEIDQHRIGTIQSTEPLYAWCRRPGSVTTDLSRWAEICEGHFDRNVYMIGQYAKRNLIGTELMIARTITDAYSMATRNNISADLSNFLDRVACFCMTHEKEFKSVPKDKLQMALEASDKDVGITEENKKKRPALSTWIRKIKIEYGYVEIRKKVPSKKERK